MDRVFLDLPDVERLLVDVGEDAAGRSQLKQMLGTIQYRRRSLRGQLFDS